MADEFRSVLFEFRGRFELPTTNRKSGAAYNDDDSDSANQRVYEELVTRLNTSSEQISSEIHRELERVLPPSISVTVQISFHSGSLGWTGIIVLMGAMGLVTDTIGFGTMVSRLSQNMIDKAVDQWINRGTNTRYPRSYVKTQVFVATPISSPSNAFGTLLTTETKSQLVNPDSIIINRLAKFIIANTILLGILVLMQVLPILAKLAAAIQSIQP